MKSLFKKSISFPKEYHHISDEVVKIINHYRKSLMRVNFAKRKKWESCFDLTMGGYNWAEICELAGIYIFTHLATIIKKSNCGLYRDGSLLIVCNVNGQQIDPTNTNIIKIFKDVGFSTEVQTNSKVVDFLDITFNLYINLIKKQTIHCYMLLKEGSV